VTKGAWLTTLDPVAVLQRVLERKPSQRKLRLISVGCCRCLWNLLHDERSKRAVEVAEDYAERRASTPGRMPTEYVATVTAVEERASEAVNTAVAFGHDAGNDAAATAVVCLALWATTDWGTFQAVQRTSRLIGRKAPMEVLACVLGIPYRRFAPPESWLTPTAVALARLMYDTRDLSLMPILADALQDAGCEDEAVLTHCRGDGPHVRGCWVVDLLLGKE
jgi:hypothetical protein